MNKELKILILEDVATDAELMENELNEAGITYVSRRAAARSAFIRELEEFIPDLILADYSLPSFDGLSALNIVQEKSLEVPFIFVSGALGEELAIDLLKKGATDYVLKNKLSRLGPAVIRALNEIEERTERKRAETALKESESRYRTIFENTGTAMIIVEEDGLISLANKEFVNLSGIQREDIESKKTWTDFIFSDDRNKLVELKDYQGDALTNLSNSIEVRFLNKFENIRDVIVISAAIPATGKFVLSFLDITERKKAELELKKREYELLLKSQSLEEANTALKVLLHHREEDKTALEDKVVSNVRKLVMPYIEKLKGLKLNENQLAHVTIINDHLTDIISPFLRNLTTEYYSLTPREIQIASLVKEGRTTKDITDLLNISSTAVDFHRKNIRLKLGIKNKKANLRSFLMSLSS